MGRACCSSKGRSSVPRGLFSRRNAIRHIRHVVASSCIGQGEACGIDGERKNRRGRCACADLTPPSSGHIPPSRAMPLMSNVERPLPPAVAGSLWPIAALGRRMLNYSSRCRGDSRLKPESPRAHPPPVGRVLRLSGARTSRSDRRMESHFHCRRVIGSGLI